ncbi:MAG: NYN domain-containing protein [Phycisphaeraceae bacterium]|nr:NYN domain-containing protein [Phycisphaeraceae bacterium]
MAHAVLLIDGYNLLHVDMPEILAGLSVERLCRLLAGRAWRDQPVMIALDGRPKPHEPSDHAFVDLTLRYSLDKTADDLIVDQVHAHTAPRRITVVTTDRDLQRRVRRRGVSVMDSEAFVGELVRLVSTPAPTDEKPDVPRDGLSARQTNRWLEEFGLEGDADVDEGGSA